jgi:DHA2 family multidrug resistance protein
MSPAGFFTILAIIVVGVLLGRGVDARWLICIGLLIVAAGNFWMSQLNLNISPGQVVWPRVVMVAGLGFVFAPINVAAYLYIPRSLRGAAIGLMSLLRNEGGSVGTSMGQTISERRDIFHALRLNENLDPLNPAVNSYVAQTQPGFLQQTGDPAAAQQMAWQSLENLREQQASALAYFDCFLIFAAVSVALAFLVLLMKRSVAEKGAHIAAE